MNDLVRYPFGTISKSFYSGLPFGLFMSFPPPSCLIHIKDQSNRVDGGVALSKFSIRLCRGFTMVLPRYNRKGSSILQKNPNAIVYFLTSSEGKINYRVRFFCRTLYTLGYPLDRRVFSTGSQDSPPVSLVSEAHRLSGV
jgi:hypothetical protein